jgi:ankyrin repeat protein
MPSLPAHPDLAQLRRQAKELLRAARSGDTDAIARIRAVSEALTLAAAQLALAREYGFASWPRLTDEVDARTLGLAERADEFIQASISGNTRRAARMLEETPGLAGHSFATAVILGDADRVRADLQRDATLATRPDARTGWTALHAACSSRWHQIEPVRADGLASVARLLLEAGSDPTGPTPRRPRGGGGWRPLRCVIAVSNSGSSNRQIVELLLERGTVPDDHDLYLAGFAHDRHQLLPLLIAKTPNLAEIAEQALAAPISNNDTESGRMLLAAGADPHRYRDDDGCPTSIICAALEAGCEREFLELLLDHRADPDAADPAGRTPYQLATAAGQTELADLLRRHGAADTATSIDRFLSACRRADRAEADRLLADDSGLLGRLSEEERAAIFRAAEHGDTAAVALMLDLGFPLETVGDDGGTALHAAAYNGSRQTVRLLLDRGADIEARDTTWNDTPLGWAAVGSGERPRTNETPNWVETVRTLLDHGASTTEISLDPDSPKPPSPEVAELLRAHLDQRPPR